MKLNRHYVCYDAVHIHRKLFNCRECGKPCTPNKYVKFKGHKFYKIATSYGCKPCDANYSVRSKE